jgi:hypothetical protein
MEKSGLPDHQPFLFRSNRASSGVIGCSRIPASAREATVRLEPPKIKSTTF